MRQIVFDTETTGLDHKDGHRIIEIGCVELLNRRKTNKTFHTYINPQRTVNPEAIKIHGLDGNFLSDKPLFSEISDPLLEFIGDSELIAHNAQFDIAFLNFELTLCNRYYSKDYSQISSDIVIDTLKIAKEKRPGKRNSLNALCRDFGIDISGRKLHGALLDAELLAEVFLALTRAQSCLLAISDSDVQVDIRERIQKTEIKRKAFILRQPNELEKENHEKILNEIRKFGPLMWDLTKNE